MFTIQLNDHQHEVLLRVVRLSLSGRRTLSRIQMTDGTDPEAQAALDDTVATLEQLVAMLKATRVGTIEHVPAQ